MLDVSTMALMVLANLGMKRLPENHQAWREPQTPQFKIPGSGQNHWALATPPMIFQTGNPHFRVSILWECPQEALKMLQRLLSGVLQQSQAIKPSNPIRSYFVGRPLEYSPQFKARFSSTRDLGLQLEMCQPL